jgi:hypothetical protein
VGKRQKGPSKQLKGMVSSWHYGIFQAEGVSELGLSSWVLSDWFVRTREATKIKMPMMSLKDSFWNEE